MKNPVKLLILSLTLLAAGCSRYEGPPEKVKIVHTAESHEVGTADQYTIVEFPDGQRRYRANHYGKEGDEFMARKARNGSWR